MALLHLSHLPSITMFAVEVTSENCPTFPTPLGSFKPALTRVIIRFTVVSLRLELSVEEPMDNLSPLFQALSSLRGLQELGLLRLDEEYPHSGEYPPSIPITNAAPLVDVFTFQLSRHLLFRNSS
ncbi:hypothetical protein PHLGIDRAFT_120087 [Phlebiopsis gigantea 11061_1 CR5-6]|uniref:Uncharacterized protein n=1 Tax=Phlebiopsis gigantea (strain 11061_1 CR5-6) TaxID=745531 RepID=A0A0C3PH15_PHLG1|nr:hypothetical protein PHLGIDRAFT_120087 [Phlebiopsis gigantea 11061_1 CR5-6]